MQFDGFISTRADSRDFGDALIHALKKGGRAIEAAEQSDLPGQTSSDHVAAAKRLIQSGYFGVVLVGPSRFNPSGSKPSYQIAELRAMKDREDRANVDSTVRPFDVFVVLLQDKDGNPAKEAFDRQLAEDNTLDADLLEWLIHHTNTTPFENHGDPSSWGFDVRINNLASAIKQAVAVGKAKVAKAKVENANAENAKVENTKIGITSNGAGEPDRREGPKDTKPTPPPRRADSPSIEAIEQAYLSNAIKRWKDGHTDRTASSRARDKGSSDAGALFGYRASRFVELNATEHYRDGSFDNTAETSPVSRWLFSPQNSPLMIFGEAGSGKTVTATAAASAFASVRSEALSAHGGAIGGGDWKKTADAKLRACATLRHFPVVARCADIADAISADPADTDLLMLAVLRHMCVEGGGSAEAADILIDEFRSRLGHEPYIFFLDGLDEIPDVRLAEDLFNNVLNLAIDFREVGMRAVFTSRSNYIPDIDAVQVHLRPPLEDWNLIENFVNRFTASRDARGAADLRHRLLERARSISDVGDGRNAPLTSPLLLNAFCYMSVDNDLAGSYEIQFCDKVVRYLVEGRRFPVIEASLQDASDEAARAAAPRRLLGWFALACIQHGKTASLPRATAESLLRQDRARLGLQILTSLQAKNILRELVRQTELLQETDNSYTFGEKSLFCEYLAGEATADGALLEQAVYDPSGENAHWRNAVMMAAAIRLERCGDEAAALETPRSLLERAASEHSAQAAWTGCRTALEILTKTAPVGQQVAGFGDGMMSLVETACSIYASRRRDWSASSRATFADLLFRLGRRESSATTCTAIDQLLTAFLKPRRRWVEVDSKQLSAPLSIADCPVLVAEYRVFVDSADRLNQNYWKHIDPVSVPGVNPQLLIGDPDDGTPLSLKRKNSWVTQREFPASPVVNVSWHEAVAYCHWETARQRKAGLIGDDEVLRLPTEDEWEALMLWAGRGEAFPWGSSSLKVDSRRVNWRRADVDRASAPGVFEATGADGLYDLGSNVSCWIVPGDAREMWPPRLLADAASAGGSWIDFKEGAFSVKARAQGQAPIKRTSYIGFRLVKAKAH